MQLSQRFFRESLPIIEEQLAAIKKIKTVDVLHWRIRCEKASLISNTKV
jgi:hypothetical protein